jgi:3-oxoacyl-[acyl-carrier-protein] synthase-1
MGLAITGLGMVSSLGLGVIQACAALRAEIVRPRELVYFQVLEEDSQELVPLMGHPIHGFTDGFAPLGRWLRLVRGAVDDLLAQGSVPGGTDKGFWQRTGLIWVGPVLDEARFLEPRQLGPQVLKQAFLQQLLQVLELPLAPSGLHSIHLGHAGTAAALQLAREQLASASVERFLIVAMDSYLDRLSLEWLHAHRRLKAPDMPVGLMPGEAAVCVLVEPLSRARRSGTPVQGFVTHAEVGQEPHPFAARSRNLGEGLSQVIGAALSRGLPPGVAFQGDVISDLNGESWRASQWGHTAVRLRSQFQGRTRLVLPCASLGDTGAASGAVGLCSAIRSFARRYASGPYSLVVSSAEHGATGAFVVNAGG